MSQVNLQVKPYKLKATTESYITRDDFVTWKYNLQSFLRQKTEWSPFMPGGEYAEWTCLDDDTTRGLITNPVDISDENSRQEAKEKSFLLQGHNEDFLTCVATFCPSGFYEFIIRESTSLQWIYDQILSTYNLQTKRQEVLNGSEIQFHFSEKFTYQHAYIQLKDFYMSALLPKGSKWKGKTLENAETLSPLAESLIIEKWLCKINPHLPAHVKKTRGHLFTESSPTLGCNQKELCKQIDIMLNEMEKEQDEANVGRLSFSRAATTQRNRAFRPRNPTANYSARSAVGPRFFQFRPAANPCQLCLQAGKPEHIARSHSFNQCQLVQSRYQPPFQNRTPAMRLIAASDSDPSYSEQPSSDSVEIVQDNASYPSEFYMDNGHFQSEYHCDPAGNAVFQQD